MYALSLGFIIFISVSFDINVNSFLYGIRQSNGAYLVVSAPDGLNATDGLANRILITDRFEAYAQSNPSIASFSWISVPIQDVIQFEEYVHLTNLGHVFFDDQSIYAASPNLFNTTIDGFLKVDSRIDKDNEFNFTVMESLYTVFGSSSIVVGSLYQDSLALNLTQHALLETKITIDSLFSIIDIRRMKILAFLDSAPAFVFSQFPGVTYQDALVSFTTFMRLSGGNITSMEDCPIRFLLLKLNEVTDSEIDDVVKDLESLVLAQGQLDVWDYRQAVSPITTANTVMSYFFNFTTVVAMLISFFSLMSSMYTNIYEQTKEIGVLRAIGVHKFWMFRIYLYEAFILVLSSSLLGILIGFIVSYTMTIQRVLFTQLPIPFSFPYVLLAIVIGCSAVFALLASFWPARSVVKLPVVQIMRMLI